MVNHTSHFKVDYNSFHNRLLKMMYMHTLLGFLFAVRVILSGKYYPYRVVSLHILLFTYLFLGIVIFKFLLIPMKA